MKPHSKSKVLLALVLAISVAATGCSAQWINVALQGLPVLTQMALDIATLVSAWSPTNQANAADQAVIQNISAQASRDLNLLQTLYTEYKANPNSTTLEKDSERYCRPEPKSACVARVCAHFKCDISWARYCGGNSDSDDGQ